jgi:predicted ATP-grasp superfamily ATP-dependent carboligase
MADVLVIALSARALAAAARKGGYAPLAADLFDDLDTREIAAAHARVAGGLDRGLERAPLLDALERLAQGRAPIGAVCGAGFEDRPELLDAVEERWLLFGNAGEAVRRAKNPEHLAALCERLAIPHPQIARAPHPGWLGKRQAGSGGTHVAAAGDGRPRGAAEWYWQERVLGAPVSALVLATGREAVALGFSAQWPDPAPGAPYRYGGAARPASLPAEIADGLAAAARSIVQALRLIGLNSVDFLVGPERWHLIEVNPRPGATLDIFEPAEGSLFELHMEACRGRLPPTAPTFAGAAAARTLYARRSVPGVPAIDWPDWAADRQPAGTAMPAGAPFCTILAHAGTAAEARSLVEARGEKMLRALERD